MSKKADLAKNTVILFLGKISTQFITFFLLPLYTTYLDASDYGIIDLIVTYGSLLVPVVTLQQEMAAFRFLIDARNDEEKKAKIIFNSLKNISISALLFAFIFGLVCIFINIPYELLILFNVITLMFSGLLLQSTRGLGKNILYSVASTITGVVTLLLNILLIVFFRVGAEGILISTILANLLCVILVSSVLGLHKYIKTGYCDKHLTKVMLKYSVPLVPNGISWWVINVSDRTIISSFLSVAANGIYAVSTKFSSIITAVFSIFSMSWTESASLHVNDEDRDIFFSDIADTIVRLFSCLCIGIVSLLPFLFGFFVNDSYGEAYNYVPINLLAAFFNCIVGIYSSIYVAKKLTKKVAYTSILAAIINVLINLVFIRLIGVYAACISTVVAYLVMAFYRHIDLKKYVELRYKLSTMIFTLSAFVLVYSLYYVNNRFLNIFSLLFVVIYSIVMNRKLFGLIYKKVKKNICKRNK